MSLTPKNTTPYTASDIEKYRKGELSARESNALEQAALDDPFLADAMEGLTTKPATPQDLTELHERLTAKVENTRRKKPVLIWRRLSIAAILILLLGIGYNLFYKSSPKFNLDRQPAVVKSATPSQNPASAEPATLIAPAPVKKPFPRKSHVTPPVPTKKTDADIAKTDADIAKTEAGIVKTKALKEELAKARSVPDSAVFNFRANNFSLNPSPLVYNGKVLDLQNRPVAGATLALGGANHGLTVTDNKGYFTFNLHPNDSASQMIVSRVGFYQTSIALNALSRANQYNNIIHLKPSNANLDEVVVIGYGSGRKETKVAAPSESTERLDTAWTIATPIIGREAYLDYLNTARKKIGLDSTITGT
jgi:hypothetical protein